MGIKNIVIPIFILVVLFSFGINRKFSKKNVFKTAFEVYCNHQNASGSQFYSAKTVEIFRD